MINSEIFTWIILPLLIFCSRIIDVSLGTIRLIFISRGKKYLAPIFGFFEILIWLLAIGKILNNLSNPLCYIAYAGGFAIGNFLGILMIEKLTIGLLLVRIITKKDASPLIKSFKKDGYGVTSITAKGITGKVHVIYTIIKNNNYNVVIEKILKFNPKAFYSIEDVKFVNEGIFPIKKSYISSQFIGILNIFKLRKSK